MTDLQLLDKYCTDRDQQAFAELAKRNVDWVYSAARRQVRDEHLAHDVTQAVFWLLANKAEHVRRRHTTNLGGWLFTVTRYASLKVLRTEARRRRRELAAASEARTHDAPADEAVLTSDEQARVSEILDGAVNGLGRTDQRAVLMRFYQGKSLRQVSEELGVSEEAARKRVTRAVAKLREMLAGSNVLVPGAALAAWLSAGVSQAAPAAVVGAVTSIAVADVAAAGSAMMLAKGAWTMMGWAKAKLVAGVCAASLVVGGTGGALVKLVAAQQTPPAASSAAQPAAAQPPVPIEAGGTTLVTVRANRATAQSVIEDLCRQANVELNVWPDWGWRDAKAVTLNAEQQPFWVAMVDACQQADLWPTSSGGAAEGPGVTIGQQGRGQGVTTVPCPRLYRDGFLVVARSIARNHSISFDRPGDASESFGMQFHVLADPKLRVLRAARSIRLTEALDEKGQSLLPEPREADLDMRSWPFRSLMVFELDARLKYRLDQGKLLKSLKGQTKFLLATKTDDWEITDLANSAGQSRAFTGGKYTIDALKVEADGRVSMKYTITYPTSLLSRGSPTENPMMDTNTIGKLIRLEDAKGHAYSTSGGGGGGGGGKLEYEISFNAPHEKRAEVGPPAKLVWSIPTEMKEVTVPIEFKDLPIP